MTSPDSMTKLKHPSGKRTRGLMQLAACAMAIALGLPLPAAAAARATSGKKTSQGTPRVKKTPRSTGADAQNSPENYYINLWESFDSGDESVKRSAMGELRGVLKKNPQDGYAHYYLGLMFGKSGNSGQAEEHLRAAAEAYPDSTDITYRLAEVLVEGGNSAEAGPLLDKVLLADANHAGALSLRGEIAFAAGDAKQAAEAFSKAHSLNPEDRDALKGLGASLVGLGRPGEAIAFLQKALVLEENDPETLWQLGKAYDATGKVKEAAEAFEKAKKFGYKDADLKSLMGYDLARALYDAGRTEAAISEYQKAIKTATDTATGYFELGKIYESVGQNPKAINAFKKAYEQDRRGEAAWRIAMIFKGEEKIELALNALEQIRRNKDEWGERAKTEIDEIKGALTQQSRDDLLEKANSAPDEKSKEKALYQMLELNKLDPEALTGLRDLAQTRGNLKEVEHWTKQMVKAGMVTKADLKAEKARLEERAEAGDDINAWESRLEEFKKDGDYDQALNELKKLKAYADSQLDYWKKQKDSDTKRQMMDLTKGRLQTYRETAKDLKEGKKWHKKKK